MKLLGKIYLFLVLTLIFSKGLFALTLAMEITSKDRIFRCLKRAEHLNGRQFSFARSICYKAMHSALQTMKREG